MGQLYDITRTVSRRTAVWPGDSPFAFEQIVDMSAGESVNLTTLTLSPHTGTHADAPWHTSAAGAHPSALGLAPYLGPAHVVHVTRRHGGITPADLGGFAPARVERLLLRTWCSDLPDDQWPEDFPYPTVALIDWLAARGGLLLGVDMPSVDAFDSTDLPGHARLRAHGMANLELLALGGVPPGAYELIALPLKLDEVCGSPVRAVLRKPIADSV